MPLDRELTEAMLAVVRARMAEQRLTGRQLAERMGVPTNTVAKHLRDEGVIPLEEWEAIALALGCNRVEELLEDARRRV